MQVNAEKHLVWIVRVLAALTVLVGGVVVAIGWVAGIEVFQRPIPAGDTMKANTAMAILMLGVALLFRVDHETPWKRRVAMSAASVALAIGGISLAQHATGIDVGIDQLIAVDPLGDPPGRPAPNTSVAFVLLALGLVGIDRFPRLATISTFSGVGLGLIGLSAYLGGVDEVHALGHITGMAAHTAGSVAAIGIGTSLLRFERGPTVGFTWDTAGGSLFRMLPAVFVVVLLGTTWILRSPFAVPEVLLLNNLVLASALLAVGVRLAYVQHGNEIHARKSLQAALDDKDRFLGVVSHELRSPASVLYGMAEILNEEGALLPEVDRSRLHEVIHRNAGDLVALTEDLLVGSRGDSMPPVADEAVAVAPQLADAIEGSQGWSTVLAGPVGPDLIVRGDPLRIRQIIRNLLTNADRYGGEEVRIETAKIGARGLIRVVDNGPGVPAGSEERVFSAYATAHGEDARSGSIGLGLSVARNLARAMGGDLTYHRIADSTTFELSLPLDAQAA